MPKISAGLLTYRHIEHGLEVLLVHLGGPFWRRKDDGAWTIPRGEVEAGEDYFTAAIREFREETGWQSQGPYLPLGEVRQRSGKTIHAWAFRGSFDPASLQSNQFETEWPPKSGRRVLFPEIERAGFFSFAEAKKKIMESQLPFLNRLEEQLASLGSDDPGNVISPGD
jgi:predicted NUDIX family NTP pyrophosphohydrolase